MFRKSKCISFPSPSSTASRQFAERRPRCRLVLGGAVDAGRAQRRLQLRRLSSSPQQQVPAMKAVLGILALVRNGSRHGSRQQLRAFGEICDRARAVTRPWYRMREHLSTGLAAVSHDDNMAGTGALHDRALVRSTSSRLAHCRHAEGKNDRVNSGHALSPGIPDLETTRFPSNRLIRQKTALRPA